MTVTGVFDPALEPAIAGRRRKVLFRKAWYPAVAESASAMTGAVRVAELFDGICAIKNLLERHGFARLRPDRPFDDNQVELVEIGS